MSEPQDKVDIGSLKDTFLECPVCVEHFNQTDRRPRLLHSCFHAFCTQCLKQLLKKEGKHQITCPLCRKVQRVTGNADTLEVDGLRDKLVEFLQIKQDNKVLCSECPEKMAAVSRCQECQSYLCKECDFVHRRHRVSRDHSILTLEDVLKQPIQSFGKGHFCPSHPKHHLEFYCVTEDKLCCVSCTVLDHKDHELQKLEEAAATRKEELVTKIKQVYANADHLRQEKKAGSQMLTCFEKTKARSISDISNIFDQLKKALDIRKHELIENVSENSRILSSNVSKMMESHEHTLTMIESTDTYFAQAKQTADTVEMLQMYPSIKRSIESLSVPHSSSISRANTDAYNLQFKPTKPEGLLSRIRQFGTFTKLSENDLAHFAKAFCSLTTEVATGEEKKCSICKDSYKDPKTLKCGHRFCSGCIDHYFNKYKPVCPNCGAIHGPVSGDMPGGNMSVNVYKYSHLPGHPYDGTIHITYSIPDGIQNEEHPNPGKPYIGAYWTSYLPDSSEGKKVLRLLKVAFDRHLTFTVGRSVTTGAENKVTWNDIHHKTSHSGNFGYPDPHYLKRVQEEMAAKGVTEADIDWSTSV